MINVKHIKKDTSPRNKPLTYPGKRPNYSFMLYDKRIIPLSFRTESLSSGRIINLNINYFLESRRKAQLKDRFAVLGYGSNPVPSQLISKLGEDTIVPVIKGFSTNVDVCYNLISSHGYAYAEILLNQPNVQTNFFVIFLDQEQLEIMNQSEQNYELLAFPERVIIETGEELGKLYFYAGKRKIWVPKEFDSPVRISEIGAKRRTGKQLTQIQTLKLAINEFELSKKGIFDVKQLVYTIRQQSANKNYDLKYFIQEKVAQDPNSLEAVSEKLK